jgi:hypothetical protein
MVMDIFPGAMKVATPEEISSFVRYVYEDIDEDPTYFLPDNLQRMAVHGMFTVLHEADKPGKYITIFRSLWRRS